MVNFDYKVYKVKFSLHIERERERADFGVLSTGTLGSQVLQLLQPGGVPLFPGANVGEKWEPRHVTEKLRWKKIKRCTMKEMVFPMFSR